MTRDTNPIGRIVVAMSGGVDSTLTAHLLREAGWDVHGVVFRFFAQSDAVDKAREAAAHLGVPLEVADYANAFETRVLRPCWESYRDGMTPNPCTVCNPNMKWAALEEAAAALDADMAATGHYARLLDDGTGRVVLARGADRAKDQSYFLYALSQRQLQRTLFPLGGMNKRDVAARAAELHFPAAGRPESQDACFAGEAAGFGEQLRRRFGEPAMPGVFLDMAEKVVGRHNGAHQFTIGQRRGLNIALGARAFVVEIRAASGEVVVSTDEADLEAAGLEAADVIWAQGGPPAEMVALDVQVRYRHTPVKARVRAVGSNRAEVLFDEPVKAITPGQAAVFYEGDRVFGGGTIMRALGTAKE